MWKRNKRIAFMLAVSTGMQVVAPSVFAYADVYVSDQDQSSVKGNLSTEIHFDYPIAFDKVNNQNLQISLLSGSDVVLKVQLGDQPQIITNKNNYTVKVVPRNQHGIEMTTENVIGSYFIDIQGLDKGTYTLKYEGDGYVTYETEPINIKDYSKNILVHTGQETFSYGDLDGDNQVTSKELDILKDDIQSGLNKNDLNGDGKVDIIDLTYLKHQLTAKGSEVQQDTFAIISSEVIASVDQGIKDAQLIVENGEISNLFSNEEGTSVTIKKQPGAENAPLQIPIDLGKEHIETQIIEIVSPVVSGGLESGELEVEYLLPDGTTDTVRKPFGEVPETYKNVKSFSRNSERNSIVIDLGKRVPVKKVTITVDKVVNESGNPEFVVLEEVNFIKDILPNGPVVDQSIVKNIQITPGDGEVSMTWNPVPNVEGYRVYYGTEPGRYTNEYNTSQPSATIEGLENLKTYYFMVRAVSQDWIGKESLEVSAMPLPSKPPKKPDFLKVDVMDRALRLSWGKTEDATYYKVFYKKTSEDTFQQFIPADSQDGKISGTSASIGGLENGTEYTLYVVAGNDIGESGHSLDVTGTPKQVKVEGPVLPTKNKISANEIENVVMTNPYNVATEFYPNGFETTFNLNSDKDGVKNLVDGEFGTHWTARRWWESTEFTFTFKEAKEMDYLIYVGRIDPLYRESLNHYNITVWEEGDDLSKPGKAIVTGRTLIKRFRDEAGSEYAVLEFPKHNVKKIAVSVAQWDGSYTNVSASEVVFYEYDSLDSEIKALFEDASFTTLAPGVTIDKINELRERLNSQDTYYVSYDVFEDELNLAESLLPNGESKVGLIKDQFISIDASKDKKVINDWSPLGVVAGPNTKFVIYADIPEGETLEIIPTQYFAEAGKYAGSPITLTPGRNVIRLPQIHDISGAKGGSLYYRYSGSNASEIKLQIRDLTKDASHKLKQIPVLELYNWYSLDETTIKEKIGTYIDELTEYVSVGKLKGQELNPYNSTEISCRNVLLSLPADQVLSGIESLADTRDAKINKLYNSLLAWEEVIGVVHTTYGLDNPNQALNSRQNIRYMRMFGKAFMYAAGSHIGISYGSVSPLVQGKPTEITHKVQNMNENELFGWGIAHEIGHNMDKLGKAEITNNIYSLMLQTYDGKDNILPSRLELSNKYEEIYKKVAVGDKGLANDVFTQLGMYWQLHLAYDEGKNDPDNGPLNFYNKLFKVYDSGAVNGFSGDDKFAVAASMVANKNLTEFFTKWGMDLSPAAKSKMADFGTESRKIQYLTDESRRLRLAGQERVESMDYTAEATVISSEIKNENNKTVRITINEDPAVAEDILGYEIFRDGKQIAFITEPTFEDVIGSANNMTFDYTVRAIDVLGNVVGDFVDAGEIKIEHDNVLSSSLYEVEYIPGSEQAPLTTGSAITLTTGPSIMITLNQKTPVTGIKVVGESMSLSGDFKLEVGVKNEDGQYEYSTAKEGNFQNNNVESDEKFINYFNKPGVASSDTRIWTYDADVIRITGDDIDESFLEQFEIMPLSYPGDYVGFEDYKMAIMGQDYGEDENGDPLLEEGTVVVVGSYRGDPNYNNIHIEGMFIEKSETGEEVVVRRPLNGELYMFAELPEDKETSDISDGFFIFVPDIQKEAELQGHVGCSPDSIFPSEIRGVMYRYDLPGHKGDTRVTSKTLWYTSPSYDSLPEITLQNSLSTLGKETSYEIR